MPVAPFSLTIATHSLSEAHQFYSEALGCLEIGRGVNHIAYKLHHHRVTVVKMEGAFVAQEHCNRVDKYDVPVPHFGIVLVEQ